MSTKVKQACEGGREGLAERMSRCRKLAVSQETSFRQLLLLLLPSNRNWRYERGKEGLREEGVEGGREIVYSSYLQFLVRK